MLACDVYEVRLCAVVQCVGALGGVAADVALGADTFDEARPGTEAMPPGASVRAGGAFSAARVQGGVQQQLWHAHCSMPATWGQLLPQTTEGR